MTKKKNGGKKRVNGIPLDGEAITRYRTAKALTQEALAALVGVDTKTIQRAEAGEPTRFYEEIAEGLDIPLLRLLKHSPEALEPPAASSTKERMRFSVIIEAPPPDLIEAFKHEPLAAKLWLFCQLQGVIRDGAPNIGLDFSSIIVSADLTEEDILRMTKAFLAGELAYLEITRISVRREVLVGLRVAPGRDITQDFLAKADAKLLSNLPIGNGLKLATVQMPQAKASECIQAANSGELKEQGILEARIIPSGPITKRSWSDLLPPTRRGVARQKEGQEHAEKETES